MVNLVIKRNKNLSLDYIILTKYFSILMILEKLMQNCIIKKNDRIWKRQLRLGLLNAKKKLIRKGNTMMHFSCWSLKWLLNKMGLIRFFPDKGTSLKSIKASSPDFNMMKNQSDTPIKSGFHVSVTEINQCLLTSSMDALARPVSVDRCSIDLQ